VIKLLVVQFEKYIDWIDFTSQSYFPKLSC